MYEVEEVFQKTEKRTKSEMRVRDDEEGRK